MTDAHRTPAAPTGDPRTWDRSQLQDWIVTHQGGKWAEYASQFAKLDGRDMTALPKEDVIALTHSEVGVGLAIYNTWQELVTARTLASLWFYSCATAFC